MRNLLAGYDSLEVSLQNHEKGFVVSRFAKP